MGCTGPILYGSLPNGWEPNYPPVRDKCDLCSDYCKVYGQKYEMAKGVSTGYPPYVLCRNCFNKWCGTPDAKLASKCIEIEAHELALRVIEDWLFGAGISRPIRKGKWKGWYK